MDNYYGFEDVDYVLVYKQDQLNNNMSEEIKTETRKVYHKRLEENGVILRFVNGKLEASLAFVLIYVPWDTLLKYADIMKLKMPLKTKVLIPPETFYTRFMNFFGRDLKYEHQTFEYLSVFRYDKIDMFDIQSEHSFFCRSKRSLIAYEILSRTQFDENVNDRGIENLIRLGVYYAAYPLHEGPYKYETDEVDLTDRQILYKIWARIDCLFKPQPLSLIRKYFGERTAIYFAWIGTLTYYMIPLATFGLMGFIYGLISYNSYTETEEICNENLMGNTTMCPLCDQVCDYWKLKESCLMSKISKLFDNWFTLIYAVFVGIWAAIYMEAWRRKENELNYDWGVHDYVEVENVRYEYDVRCTTEKYNIVTGEMEKQFTFKQKVPRLVGSAATVVLMVVSVIMALLGLILFRVTMLVIFIKTGNNFINSYARIFASVLVATINLAIIVILDQFYRILAMKMTDFENPRTESEFEDSFTLKMYIFNFFNFYGSLFYIAFLKGTFIGKPGDYIYIFGFRQEECDPAGCLIELSIQMIIIFGGKQIILNVIEFIFPYLKSYKQSIVTSVKLHKFQNFQLGMLLPPSTTYTNKSLKQWEADFTLMDVESLDFFDEYLEIVIQYGFVTMFSIIMPLAPLLAVLNNIFEIRLDAFKMLANWKRTKARMTHGIGIWNEIIRFITVLSITMNAFIICETSQIVPIMVYRYRYSSNFYNLSGFVNYTLSVFDVNDFQEKNIPFRNITYFHNVSYCAYRSFRNPPWVPKKYNYSTQFWHVLAAKFAFVILFEHVIFFLSKFIDWLLPNQNNVTRIRIEQEKYINKQLLFQSGEGDGSKKLAKLLHDIINKTEQTNIHDEIHNDDADTLLPRSKSFVDQLMQLSSTLSQHQNAFTSLHPHDETNIRPSNTQLLREAAPSKPRRQSLNLTFSEMSPKNINSATTALYSQPSSSVSDNRMNYFRVGSPDIGSSHRSSYRHRKSSHSSRHTPYPRLISRPSDSSKANSRFGASSFKSEEAEGIGSPLNNSI